MRPILDLKIPLMSSGTGSIFILLGFTAEIKYLPRGIIIMKNNQQQNISINIDVYQGKPQTPGKNPTNEISLNIGQNFGQSGQVSLHCSPPGLHYNEVFPTFYRLHYMQYHGLKTMGAQYHMPQNHYYLP